MPGRPKWRGCPPLSLKKKKVVSVRVTCSLVPSLDLVWAACDMQLLPVAGDNNAWCMQVVGYFVRDDRRPPTRQTVTVGVAPSPRGRQPSESTVEF